MVWSNAVSIPPQEDSPSQLPLSMPDNLPSPAMVSSSKWLVRALLTLHAGSSYPTLSDLRGKALPIGSQSSGWLASCLGETPAQLVEWLAVHALSESKDLHLLSLALPSSWNHRIRTAWWALCKRFMPTPSLSTPLTDNFPRPHFRSPFAHRTFLRSCDPSKPTSCGRRAACAPDSEPGRANCSTETHTQTTQAAAFLI